MKNFIFQGKERFIVPIYEDNIRDSENIVNPINPGIKKKFLKKYETDNFEQCQFVPLSPLQVERQLSNVKQVTFEITDACNLNCQYCGYGDIYNDYDKRNETYMNSQVAQTLIGYLANFWNSDTNTSYAKDIFISFYGGEPLLHMSFIKDVVSYCEQLNLKHNSFIFSLTTNALLLHKHIDFFAEKKFRLLISLDGDRKNNSYRVSKSNKESFDLVMENIEKARNFYPDYFRDHINFNSVLHNRNSVSEVYDFFKTNFDKRPSIGELNTSGIKGDKIEEFDKMFNNSVKSLYSSQNRTEIMHDMFLELGPIQSLGIFLREFSGNVFSTYLDLLTDNKIIKRTPTGTCVPFAKKIFLTVNGKILPCEKVSHQFQLGTVSKEYVDIDCEKIATKYNGYYGQILPQCTICKNKMACTQCVFHLKNIKGKPICQGFMNEKRLAKYIDSMLNIIKEDPSLYENILNSSTII